MSFHAWVNYFSNVEFPEEQLRLEGRVYRQRKTQKTKNTIHTVTPIPHTPDLDPQM